MYSTPDLIVSIDLGTTFTGVAWRTPRTPIQVINDWPGSGDRSERKVPTTLVYNPDGTLSSWGYICADDTDETTNNDHEPSIASQKIRREFFKIFIDSSALASAQTIPRAPKTLIEAQKFTTDYLSQVYAHIKESIEMQLGVRHMPGGWAELNVVFLFSVPTTWTRMETINIYKGIIRDAGFGLESIKHSALVDLTEAEAAAVATLKTSSIVFKHGSVFLTVDAGGGTTDLSLMRITSTDPDYPQMSQISTVKGVGIGSILIDRAFIRLVDGRFEDWPDMKTQLPANLAVQLSKSHQFRNLKHKFGERVYELEVYRLQMDGVSQEFSHSGLRIKNGQMEFTKQEIESLFEEQIEGVMREVIGQLNWLSQNLMSDQVDFVVLSGGLGSSAYVRKSIQKQLSSLRHPSATQVVVVPCQDPQLVVARGLLLDHQQSMEREGQQRSVLATRVARASYGVVLREIYSASRHFDADVVQDEMNPKRMWAMDQIQWMIKKGDTIDTNSPLIRKFAFYLSEQETAGSWNTDIVISQNEPSFLPSNMKQAGATKLCRVNSNLAGIEQHQCTLKKKRGNWFRKGYKFYMCEFEVRITIAPADLRFEVWLGGQRFSRNHETIGVTWDEEGVRVGGY